MQDNFPYKPPNPGSDEAIEKGCLCPVIDNAGGAGIPGTENTNNPNFWINELCPLHNPLQARADGKIGRK